SRPKTRASAPPGCWARCLMGSLATPKKVWTLLPTPRPRDFVRRFGRGTLPSVTTVKERRAGNGNKTIRTPNRSCLCLHNLAGFKAGSADAHPLGGAIHDGPHRTQVHI